MDHPVVADDGHSYNPVAIETSFRTRRTSPLRNEELKSTRLLPNHSLRNAIEQWREQQPLAIDSQRLLLSEDEVLGERQFRPHRGWHAPHWPQQGAAGGGQDAARSLSPGFAL